MQTELCTEILPQSPDFLSSLEFLPNHHKTVLGTPEVIVELLPRAGSTQRLLKMVYTHTLILISHSLNGLKALPQSCATGY